MIFRSRSLGALSLISFSEALSTTEPSKRLPLLKLDPLFLFSIISSSDSSWKTVSYLVVPRARFRVYGRPRLFASFLI